MDTRLKVILLIVGVLALITALLVASVDGSALRTQSRLPREGYRPDPGGNLSGSGFGQVLVNFFSLQWLFGTTTQSTGRPPASGPLGGSSTGGTFGGATSGSSGGGSIYSILRFGGREGGSTSGGSGRFLQF